MSALSHEEVRATLKLCLLATFADGENGDAERDRFQRMTGSMASRDLNFSELYQEARMVRPRVEALAQSMHSAGARKLAYEMAVCICEADSVLREGEKRFLQDLRSALRLTAAESARLLSTAATVAIAPAPLEPPKTDRETDAMILHHAIVAGALELLPQTMASLAIVPLQTKMVYRIGNRHGVSLDRQSVGEFMANVGLGLASQVFEGVARRLTRSLGSKEPGGRREGKVGGALGDIAVSFAATYAVGHLARLYYSSGRNVDIETLRSRYAALLEDGRALARHYTGEVVEQSRRLRHADMNSIMKNPIVIGCDPCVAGCGS